MAIISSNINESDSSFPNKGLKVVKEEITTEDIKHSNHNDNRPKYLSEFIGHEKLKSSLQISINASLLRKECLEHIIFYGQPGLGKTTLAQLIANEMESKCKITHASSIERPRDIVGLLLSLKNNEILFIDEIHRLSKLTEEILYPAMEDFKLDLTVGANRGTRCRTINLPKFTLIGATTKLASISSPLRDRFGISHKIDLYSSLDLQKIILNYSDFIGVCINNDASMKLAACSRGTPRIAIRLLKRARDYSQVIKQKNEITASIVEEVLCNQNIDQKGLNETDRKFMTFLYKNNHVPIGLESVAAGLCEDSSMLEFVVEPYLIQLGFISRTSRGRVLTTLGESYIKQFTFNK
tara:strand:- start:1744 stop:2802 length:1059 start_codon:yes stop_codon:yes gene_type:complete